MLGHFLEFSVAAQPLAPTFEFYSALGFETLPVGDLLVEPYLAFFDGAIAIGAYQREHASPALTFVRPQLRDYVRGLRRLGIELEYSFLKDDEFNRVCFEDPNGQAVVLLEARTFAPADWNPHNVTACGAFVEFSLATDSLAISRAYWEALGLHVAVAGEAPHAWARLVGHGLVLGLHETHFRPGLSFRTEQLDARVEFLQAKDLSVRARSAPPFAHAHRSATLHAPDGTAIYLFETRAD